MAVNPLTSLLPADVTYGVVSSNHLLSLLGEGKFKVAVSEEGLLTVSHWLGWVLTCLRTFSSMMSQHMPSTVVTYNTCDAVQLRTLYAQLTDQLYDQTSLNKANRC